MENINSSLFEELKKTILFEIPGTSIEKIVTNKNDSSTLIITRPDSKIEGSARTRLQSAINYFLNDGKYNITSKNPIQAEKEKNKYTFGIIIKDKTYNITIANSSN